MASSSKLDTSTTGNAVSEELEMAVLNGGEGRQEVSTDDDAVPRTSETEVSHPKSKSPERRVSLAIAINEVASTSSISRQSNEASPQAPLAMNDIIVPEIRITDTDLRPGSPPPIIPVPKSPVSWHPKLTPFRLLNLVLPISISTAKAITSLRGNSTVPTTLELISGIVVFLVLFHAGYYETQVKPPHYLQWVFETDCLEYLWRLFEFCSFPRPHYGSTEDSDFVMFFTPYHLLVTQTVVFFGLLKAVLTATEYTVAAVWVEWVLAAVLTSCLYIAGLYEYGSAEIWPSFYQEPEDNWNNEIQISRWKTGSPLIATAIIQFTNTFFVVLGGYLIIDSLYPVVNWEHLTQEERVPYALQEHVSGPDGSYYRPGSRPTLWLVMMQGSVGLVIISIGFLIIIAVTFGTGALRFLKGVQIMVHVLCIVGLIVGLGVAGFYLDKAWFAIEDKNPIFYLILLISASVMLFLMLIGMLFASVRRKAKDIGVGILHRVFPRVFRASSENELRVPGD